MTLQQHIILIGPMGAGKSTIGRLLSESLEADFVDLDKEIEERSGATIPWIFDIEGEEGFRERETQTLLDVLAAAPVILATGGGCILKLENRQCIYQGGLVIYLAASVEQQIIRTAKDKNRPLLQTANPEKVLREMAKVRTPIYQETAHLSVDTNSKPPKLVVQEIIQFTQNYSNENHSS